jgi:hypothetical protein
MLAPEKWHDASSKLRTHKIRRHSAQCGRPGFVNHSATFLSKHATALFLALRFTPFCFNVSNLTNLRHVFYALSFSVYRYFPAVFTLLRLFTYVNIIFCLCPLFQKYNNAFVYLQN